MTVVGKLSFRYFKNEPFKAQLVCLMLVANEEMREINQLLFNDSILALYVVLCIYFVSGNRPLLAAQMLTMAMSIKAGAMLLVPSFLGAIQYQWGTLKLVIVLIIIVSW
jgi:Gpi18-like mannosyltransferase